MACQNDWECVVCTGAGCTFCGWGGGGVCAPDLTLCPNGTTLTIPPTLAQLCPMPMTTTPAPSVEGDTHIWGWIVGAVGAVVTFVGGGLWLWFRHCRRGGYRFAHVEDAIRRGWVRVNRHGPPSEDTSEDTSVDEANGEVRLEIQGEGDDGGGVPDDRDGAEVGGEGGGYIGAFGAGTVGGTGSDEAGGEGGGYIARDEASGGDGEAATDSLEEAVENVESLVDAMWEEGVRYGNEVDVKDEVKKEVEEDLIQL